MPPKRIEPSLPNFVIVASVKSESTA